MTMADTIAVMNKGRIEQLGAPAELYELPRTAFVANFLGQSNLFTGPVVSAKGDTIVVDIAGRKLTVPATRASIDRRRCARPIRIQASAVAPGIASNCAAGPARVCHSSSSAATKAGAATAAAKALPVLKGKLTGNAIRVPTPNVSMAILNLNLEKATSREEINEYLRQMAMHSDLQKQIDFVNSQEVVSTDFVGSRHAGVVDAEATICNDNRVVLYVWYDNEFGYSNQVVRIVEELAGARPEIYPRRLEAVALK